MTAVLRMPLRFALILAMLMPSLRAAAQAESTPPNWPACPAQSAIPERAASAPVDDFDGLRLGVPLDTALVHAACAERRREPKLRPNAIFGTMVNTLDMNVHWIDRDGFNYLDTRVRTLAGLVLGVGRPRTPRFSANPEPDLFGPLWEQITQGGYVEYSFAAFGGPGTEKVYAFTRYEGFPESAPRPVFAEVVARAVQKYGEPIDREDTQGGTDLFWLYDPGGQPLAPPSMPAAVNARPRPAAVRPAGPACKAPIFWTQHHRVARDYGVEASRGCGLAIFVRVVRASNGTSAHAFYVGLRDPSAFVRDEKDNRQEIAGASASQQRAAPAPRF